MKRQLIYPGAIPLETDLLGTNKNTMVALGKLAAAALGVGTVVNGLTCAATAPASLSVSIGPGEIYALQSIDSTAYSSIAADTAHQIMKQGIQLDAVQLACPAPTTGGNSINYLIQAAFSEVDGEAVVLPYYNASNPAQAYSGPVGAGTTNNTSRDGKVVLVAKAGVSAATGTQMTPAPDSGYVGLWVVTVANGQATIVAGNIVQYASSPMLANSILAMAQASVKTIKRLVFSGSGTYIPSPGMVYADIELVGGGAGGGGATGGSSGSSSAGAGGGAGGYTKKLFTAAAIGASRTIVIGAGGTGGAAGANGGTGGDSSVTGLLTANRGSGGGGSASFTTIALSAVGGLGGLGAGGDVNKYGAYGGDGIVYAPNVGLGGRGGDGMLGTGGYAGAPGSGYGTGGGGGSAATVSQAGASGTAGVCIITEYCSI